ncbi:MAG: PfkB family carbohydrate kinase, partial [Solirubrobacteraceae bacterium]
MRDSRIVTLGEAMLRLTAAPGERLESASQLRSDVAGSEANVARTLARLGAPVSWVSALPDSPLGERVLRQVRADGVDTSFVQRPSVGRVGLFFVEQGASPRASRVWYDRAGSTFARMSTFEERALEGAAFAVVSGITAALGARGHMLAESFAARSRAVGARLCVDVNYRQLLWSPAAARRGLAGLLAQADVVLCSERDARAVLSVAGSAAELIGALAERWAPQASIVAVTCGARGSLLLSAGRVIEQPAPAVTMVDRFGAGDAFLAGLIWGLWSGESDAESLRCAAMLAALKCTLIGDVAALSACELQEALAEQDS